LGDLTSTVDYDTQIMNLDTEIEELTKKYELEVDRITATVDGNIAKLKEQKPPTRRSTGSSATPTNTFTSDAEEQNTYSASPKSSPERAERINNNSPEKTSTLPHRIRNKDEIAPRRQALNSSSDLRENTISSPIKSRKSVSSIFDSNLNPVNPYHSTREFNSNFSSLTLTPRESAKSNQQNNNVDPNNTNTLLTKIQKSGVELLDLLKQDDIKLERLQGVVRTLVDDFLRDTKKIAKEKPTKELSAAKKPIRKALKKNIKETTSKSKVFFADVTDVKKKADFVNILTSTIKVLNQYCEP